ncbi:UTRA domain-containing protein [Cupriavidus sp. Agwp_2]|uniref:UTRA domain-containing protein n=1 Tax=Cupriavidus sp. Agwp_2 TaxID=2897324 RepID=UPI00345FFFE1
MADAGQQRQVVAGELVTLGRHRATPQGAPARQWQEGEEIVRLTRLRMADGQSFRMEVTMLARTVLPDASAIGESPDSQSL